MKIENHLLMGEGIDFNKTDNNGGFFSKEPDHIVIHYTAGSSREGSVSWHKNPDSKVSSHLIVGRDQKITQLVPFNVKAYHARAWNGRSIGIEIDNAGRLHRLPDGAFRADFGRRYDGKDVIEMNGEYWHDYTEWQIEKVFEVCRKLVDEYPSIKGVVGHSEIDPKRKIDPGPHFPLERLKQHLFYSRSDESFLPPTAKYQALVTASKLNVRDNPSGSVVMKPLSKGKRVEVLSVSRGWSKVRVSVDGWVASNFLEEVKT